MVPFTPASGQTAHPLPRRTVLPAFGVEVWLGLILVGHVVLAVWYSLVIPPWEAHDEWAHFRHAAYIAENRALPDPNVRLTTEFEFDEATQPPLYYVLASLPMLMVDTRDGYRPEVNPYASRGTGMGGVNMVLHDPLTQRWPYQGTLLALHLGRLVSVVVSTAGLYFTYRISRLLSPQAGAVALVAVGIQAFAPQYVFLSAVMTNDILLIVLETALLFYLLQLVREGFNLRTIAGIGLAFALALLTKYLALAMIPVLVAGIALASWKHRWRTGGRRAWAAWLLLVAPIVLVTLGWLGRNLLLTGVLLPRDPKAQANLLAGLAGARDISVDLGALATAIGYGFRTYWVSFGWGNVGAPSWVYTVWLVLLLGGAAGLLVWLRSGANRPSGALLAVIVTYVAAVVSLPLLRELLHDTNLLRGRYVLSTLPVAAWVMAQGWAQLSGRGWWITQKALIAWPALLTVALAPFVLTPAYAAPRTVIAEESPGQWINANFGGKARLLKADVWPADRVAPGEGLAVTLTWEAIDRTDIPYTVAVHLVGAGRQSYGSATSYPDNGRAPTTFWLPGSTFTETYWIVPQSAGRTPAQGRIKVALFSDSEEPGYLQVFDASGTPLGDALFFGDVRIDKAAGAANAPVQDAALASFGDRLALTDARLPTQPQQPGWAVPVSLRWQVLASHPEPLQHTVQLLDAEGNWVAGADGSLDTDLPPHLWQPGDSLRTVRWLTLPSDLPPGVYQLVTALYRPGDLTRLTANDAAGLPLPNDAYLLGQLTVAAP